MRMPAAAAAALLAAALSAAPAVTASAASAAAPPPVAAATATPDPGSAGNADQQASAPVACPDYEFVGARGSGEDNGVAESKRYTQANPTHGMGGEVWDVFKRLNETAAENGVVLEPFGVPYPAVGIDVVSGATLSSGSMSVYTKSVELGAHAAAAEIERVARSCDNTRVIVAGYSQGAQAVVDAVQTLTPGARARVSAAVFFGSTYFNASESEHDYGSYDPRLDGYLAHAGVLPGGEGEGAASGTDWAKAFGDAAIFDYCHNADPICGLVDERTVDGKPYPVRDFAHIVGAPSNGAISANILTQHTTYMRGDTANAAQQLRLLLGLPLVPAARAPKLAVTAPSAVATGAEFTLNAGGSLSDPADPIVSYGWTTDAGSPDSQTVTTLDPLFTSSFTEPGAHTIRLETTTLTGQHGSTTVSVSVDAAPFAAPAQPDDVEAISGDGAVTLTWPEVDGAEFYAVADAKGLLLTAFTPLVPDQNPVSWTDSGLRNDKERSYRVYAVSGAGSSEASALVKVTPRAADGRPLSAPIKLAVPTTTLVDAEVAWAVGLTLIAVVLAIALITGQRRRF